MRAPLAPPEIAAAAQAGQRGAFGVGPRGFWLLAAGLLWIVPAWLDRRTLIALLLWDLLVVACWLIDLRRLPAPSQLRVRRIWQGPLGLGMPQQVSLALHNGGTQAIAARLVDFAAPELRADPAEVEIVVLPGREAIAEAYTLQPRERGDATMGPVLIRYRSGWNLATRWATAPLPQPVRVYPNLREAERQSLLLVRTRQTAVERRRVRERGAGREFESLREYQDGDDPRDICWSAAARRGHLVTKRYQPERSQTVWILVDAGRLLRARVQAPAPRDDWRRTVGERGEHGDRTRRAEGIERAGGGERAQHAERTEHAARSEALSAQGSHAAASDPATESRSRAGAPTHEAESAAVTHSKLDYGVSSALALAQVAMLSGDRVGLLAYGRRPQQRVAPGRGAAHLRTLVEALAAVRAETVEADHTAAASAVLSMQKRRALIVWLTDIAETAGVPEVIDSSRRMAPRHVVLLGLTREPALSALADARPASTDEMYRVMAAQQMTERREELLHSLRERGVMTLELPPGELGAGLVERYLSVKARSVL